MIVGDDAVFPDVSGISNGFVYRNGHATDLNTLIAPAANVRLGGTAVLTARDGTVSTVGYELLPL